MSTAKHTAMNAHGTPGPYVIREEKRPGDAPRITVQASNGLVLAKLDGYNTAERRTLARQFAAAPELLDIAVRVEAMLTRQRWVVGGNDPEALLLQDARAAIARLTGGRS